MTKTIEIKRGNKTIYRIVPDDYKEDGTDDRPIGDLTTSNRKSMSYYDIQQSRWDRIFKKDKK